jgi:hypothetical protein
MVTQKIEPTSSGPVNKSGKAKTHCNSDLSTRSKPHSSENVKGITASLDNFMEFIMADVSKSFLEFVHPHERPILLEFWNELISTNKSLLEEVCMKALKDAQDVLEQQIQHAQVCTMCAQRPNHCPPDAMKWLESMGGNQTYKDEKATNGHGSPIYCIKKALRPCKHVKEETPGYCCAASALCANQSMSGVMQLAKDLTENNAAKFMQIMEQLMSQGKHPSNAQPQSHSMKAPPESSASKATSAPSRSKGARAAFPPMDVNGNLDIKSLHELIESIESLNLVEIQKFGNSVGPSPEGFHCSHQALHSNNPQASFQDQEKAVKDVSTSMFSQRLLDAFRERLAEKAAHDLLAEEELEAERKAASKKKKAEANARRKSGKRAAIRDVQEQEEVITSQASKATVNCQPSNPGEVSPLTSLKPERPLISLDPPPPVSLRGKQEPGSRKESNSSSTSNSLPRSKSRGFVKDPMDFKASLARKSMPREVEKKEHPDCSRAGRPKPTSNLTAAHPQVNSVIPAGSSARRPKETPNSASRGKQEHKTAPRQRDAIDEGYSNRYSSRKSVLEPAKSKVCVPEKKILQNPIRILQRKQNLDSMEVHSNVSGMTAMPASKELDEPAAYRKIIPQPQSRQIKSLIDRRQRDHPPGFNLSHDPVCPSSATRKQITPPHVQARPGDHSSPASVLFQQPQLFQTLACKSPSKSPPTPPGFFAHKQGWNPFESPGFQTLSFYESPRAPGSYHAFREPTLAPPALSGGHPWPNSPLPVAFQNAAPEQDPKEGIKLGSSQLWLPSWLDS